VLIVGVAWVTVRVADAELLAYVVGSAGVKVAIRFTVPTGMMAPEL
jgi:hypothetical protein